MFVLCCSLFAVSLSLIRRVTIDIRCLFFVVYRLLVCSVCWWLMSIGRCCVCLCVVVCALLFVVCCCGLLIVVC